MSLTREQERKWEELDTFFKNNSKYYKKLDNTDITFTVWKQGAAGDFIVSLFLHNLLLDLDLAKYEASANLYYENRYPQLTPCIETRIDSAIYVQNQTVFDLEKRDTQHFNKMVNAFLIYKKLQIPDDLADTDLDAIFSNAFITSFKYQNINPMASHHLPIIPFFYYKNFNKVKIILIESDNKPTQQYLELLATIKRHASGTLKFLGPSEMIEFERFTEQETIEVANEIREVYYNITKNLNEKVSDAIIAELLVNCVGDDEFKTIGLETALRKKITEYLIEIESIDLNKTEIVTPPDKWRITARPISGMMDEFPKTQFYRVRYEDLIIHKDPDAIKLLMSLYNANNTVEFYQEQIQHYHNRNISMVRKVKELLTNLVMEMSYDYRTTK